MARPIKSRKVCYYPVFLEYVPKQNTENHFSIVMSVDEYEAIRLIDQEGFSQEKCSEIMGVARTTIQRIYEAARKKIANAMIQGYSIRIEGGDFWICDGSSASCENPACYKAHYHMKYKKSDEENILRIAIPYENGKIFQNFERTETFKIYDIRDKKIVFEEEVQTKEKEGSTLSGILIAMNVDVLICGEITRNLQQALVAGNIRIINNIPGLAEYAIKEYLSKM